MDWGLNVNRVLWLAPLVMALHNLEEALTMPWWRGKFPGWPPVTPLQYDAALLAITLVPLLLAPLAVRYGKRSIPVYLLCGVQGIMLWNALVHLGAAFYFRGYVPGVFTAVFLIIPYAHDLYGRGLHMGYITQRGLTLTLIAGLLLYTPLLYLALQFGRLF